ncbi:hypothetical protein EON62_02175 [archaeon]|nr:MAG: hypothetical protein EON62_02175 [archaeon]
MRDAQADMATWTPCYRPVEEAMLSPPAKRARSGSDSDATEGSSEEEEWDDEAMAARHDSIGAALRQRVHDAVRQAIDTQAQHKMAATHGTASSTCTAPSDGSGRNKDVNEVGSSNKSTPPSTVNADDAQGDAGMGGDAAAALPTASRDALSTSPSPAGSPRQTRSRVRPTRM